MVKILSTSLQSQTLDEEIVYQNKYLKILRQQHLLSSGKQATFFLRKESDVVVCVPVTKDGMFVVVEEFRPGPGRVLLEVPGGCIEPGEEPTDAVIREMREETGYTGQVQHLATTYFSAYSNARKHIYIMLNAECVGEPILEETDSLKPRLINRAEFITLIESGELTDLDAALTVLRFLDNTVLSCG